MKAGSLQFNERGPKVRCCRIHTWESRTLTGSLLELTLILRADLFLQCNQNVGRLQTNCFKDPGQSANKAADVRVMDIPKTGFS
jgi:hypothetical protein